MGTHYISIYWAIHSLALFYVERIARETRNGEQAMRVPDDWDWPEDPGGGCSRLARLHYNNGRIT